MAAAIPVLMALFTLAILAGMLAWSELFEPAIAAAIAGAYQGNHRKASYAGKHSYPTHQDRTLFPRTRNSQRVLSCRGSRCGKRFVGHSVGHPKGQDKW